MKSISEIRTEFEACRGSRAELYEMYAYDTRMGVQKLIQKYLQYLLDRWILHRILVKCYTCYQGFHYC